MARWAKVWVVLVVLTGATLLLIRIEDNTTLEPAAVFLGALSGPMAFAVWVTDRTRIGRSVAPDVLFMSLLVGGGVAMLFAGLFQAEFWFQPVNHAYLWIATTEEAAKLILPLGVYIVLPKYRTVEQALAFGIVSAAGFATFESMAFALSAISNDSVKAARRVLFERSIITPFGHLPWTGLAVVVATAAWQASGRVRPTPRALWGVVVAIALHTAWNVAIVHGGWWWIATAFAAVATFGLFRWVLDTVYYSGPYIVPPDHPGRPPRHRPGDPRHQGVARTGEDPSRPT